MRAGAQAGAQAMGIGGPTSSTSMAGTPTMIVARSAKALAARNRARRGTGGEAARAVSLACRRPDVPAWSRRDGVTLFMVFPRDQAAQGLVWAVDKRHHFIWFNYYRKSFL